MSSESKVVRSDRFTLSVTGFALIALIIGITTSAQAEAGMPETIGVTSPASSQATQHGTPTIDRNVEP